MKQLALMTLLAVLLAGCSASQTKEAAIEDRTVKTEAVAEPVAKDKGAEAAQTTPTTTQDVSEKSVQAASTQAGEAKPRVETQAVADAKSVDAIQVAAPVTPAQEAATLPRSEPAPAGWSDLKNPSNVLSKRRLLFDFDSAAIRDEYRAMLEAHARFLRDNRSARLLLQGHTDERGSRDYNLALGQHRAESVFKALNLLGAPVEQMEAVSLGEEKPIAEGYDESAWQQNRRAELLYSGE